MDSTGGWRDEQLWADQEALSTRPSGRPVMYQRWSDLTFLHWRVDPDVVQRTLPEGLTVDVFDGHAYVGLVPFSMSRIRPRFLPPIPWLSYFHETNVRTYVHQEGRQPGVWFYSLEASNRLAVKIARSWFGLPYFAAQMGVDSRHLPSLFYRSNRLDGTGIAPASSEVAIVRPDQIETAGRRTLEYFLIERYLLFSQHQGRLRSGRVHHSPYRFQVAQTELVKDSLVEASFGRVQGAPDLVHYSPGVSVSVFGLEDVSRFT